MSKLNFKKQKNLLKDLMLKELAREYSKQTINGLFRSILEPAIELTSQSPLVLLRLKDLNGVSSILKRLEYSSAKVYSFSDDEIVSKFENIQKNKCWGNIEFIVVLAPRYSAALLWDSSLASLKDSALVHLVYNSRQIADIARIIFDNSNVNLDQYLTDFAPDRRENELLNTAIGKLTDNLNSLNEEVRITEAERETLGETENKLQEYEYTSSKAKVIAHEIKNQLSIIDLYSKILENRVENGNADKNSKESSINAVNNIKKAAYSISQFLNELKTFAKPILVERRLSSIISEVVESSLPKAKDAKVSIECDIKNDYKVHVDEVKIQSVLLNLLYNAIESINDKGRVSIQIDSKKDNKARVLIKDNGTGIAKELQHKIFEFGFTTKIEGNGLGLYICKSLMKEQYGDINLVESNEQGTTFEILIPII